MDKVNPETIINASMAAMAAQQAAWQAFLLTAVLILIVTVVVILTVVMLLKIDRIEKHTNSMREQLVSTSRKLGVFEGREEQKIAERGDVL